MAALRTTGKHVAGADRIWIAVVGPDTPAHGEVTRTATYHQRDIAPTALALLGWIPPATPARQAPQLPSL